MFQFIRNVIPKNGALVPAALQFAADVSAHVNKTYAINLRYGIQLFGPPRVDWEFESDSLDKMSALNAKLMQDREYLKMLDRAKELWVEGSLVDTIVSFAG